MEYDNTDKGVAFRNDYKKSEKQPDFKGKGNFKGVDFEVAIWERFGKNGQFFSFSFQEPYVRPDGGQPQPEHSGYDSFQNSRPQLKKDIPLEDISNEPISLDDIPFK